MGPQFFMTRPKGLNSIEPLLAYTVLGWLLGTLPPASILLSLTVSSNHRDLNQILSENSLFFVVFFTAICSVVGLLSGLTVGAIMMLVRQKSWIWAVLLATFLGFVWAIVTGGLGGILYFVIGGIVGAILAVPVGVFGFMIFAAAHEPLLREEKLRAWHVPALAFGVAILFSVVMPVSLFLFTTLRGW